MSGSIEREILRLERELNLLRTDVVDLMRFRQPSIEQQLGALWFNPAQQVSGTIVLTSSPTTWIIGSNSFTATLSGTAGTPTGTVSFYLDGVIQGSPVTISGGVATTSFSITSGSHTVLAVYSGDMVYTSGQASLTQTVSGATHAYCGCTGVNAVPEPLTFVDSRLGNTTLAFDSTNQFGHGSAFFGCVGPVTVVPVAPHAGCSHVSTYILHVLWCNSGMPQLDTAFLTDGSGCALSRTCAQQIASYKSNSANQVTWDYAGSFVCKPFSVTFFYDVVSGITGSQLGYINGDSVTIHA